MLPWTVSARLVGFAVGIVTLASLVPVSTVSAAEEVADAATPIESLSISGRGWGHGRGMSQYGALGYASVEHWSATEILDHYYGGTTSTPIPVDSPVDPNAVRVDLRYMHDADTAVAVGTGGLELVEADGSTVRNIDEGAVRLRLEGDTLLLQTSNGCDGQWSPAENINESSVEIRSKISQQADYDPSKMAHLLEVCGASYHGWYEGSIQATSDDGESRTVNIVPVETYLRGVVPNEVIASWPEATLQAQAVAARSYLMAGDTRQQPYADTCDTTRCQVYDGVFSSRGVEHAATHPRTDEAIEVTAGIVRTDSSGAIARTEFSASSGGHTVGGDFPAVDDLGDELAGNPHHAWSVTVDPSDLEAAYGLGDLIGIEVVERNGLGDYGGRATNVALRFETESVIVSGNVVRQHLGLKSDWFVIN